MCVNSLVNTVVVCLLGPGEGVTERGGSYPMAPWVPGGGKQLGAESLFASEWCLEPISLFFQIVWLVQGTRETDRPVNPLLVAKVCHSILYINSMS